MKKSLKIGAFLGLSMLASMTGCKSSSTPAPAAFEPVKKPAAAMPPAPQTAKAPAPAEFEPVSTKAPTPPAAPAFEPVAKKPAAPAPADFEPVAKPPAGVEFEEVIKSDPQK